MFDDNPGDALVNRHPATIQIVRYFTYSQQRCPTSRST